MAIRHPDRTFVGAGGSNPGRPSIDAVHPAGTRSVFAGIAGLSALAVAILAALLAGRTTPTTFDRWADAEVTARVPWLRDMPFDLIGSAGDPLPAIVLTTMLALLCHRLGSRGLARATVLGSALTGIVTTALKSITGRTIHGDNLCFPSGHTAAITGFGLVLGLLVVQRRGIGQRLLAPLVALTFAGAAATSIALLLLNGHIHYATDTLGGSGTALSVFVAVGLVIDRRAHNRLAERRTCPATVYPPALLPIAGYGLPSVRADLPAQPLGESEWDALVAAAERNRLTGLLLAAVRDGALPTTAAQAGRIRALHRGKLLRVMALEQELIGIIERLSDAGIDSRVLKGSACANLDYPDPALRSFIDVDLLLRPEDIDRAVALLADAGYHRTLAEPRPGFDRRYDKGLTMITPSGFELDLHRTFVLGPWGMRVDLPGLWTEYQEYSLGGHPLRALSAPNRFMHACYHAALGDWPLRLGSLRDIAEIVGRMGPEHARLRSLAESWGVEAVVAAAVADTDRLLGTEIDPELSSWAANYRPRERDLRWLALHTHEDKTFAAQAIATLRELPSWRDKLAYTRALVRPDTEYTADRHSSAVARFGYALREIRKGRGLRRP
jgi:membrane-associated phospholipid phosphatase